MRRGGDWGTVFQRFTLLLKTLWAVEYEGIAMQIETVNPTRLANVIKSLDLKAIYFHWHLQNISAASLCQADVASLSSSVTSAAKRSPVPKTD
jgi:hypothetical protein